MSISEPVVEAAFLDLLWHPVSGLVIRQQTFLDLLHGNEPRWNGAIDERRVGAPAIGVLVLEHAVHNESTLALEHLPDALVCVLHVLSNKVGDLGRVAAICVDGAREDCERTMLCRWNDKRKHCMREYSTNLPSG